MAEWLRSLQGLLTVLSLCPELLQPTTFAIEPMLLK